ncbi:MAG: hypothetical protein IKO72_13830 [Kiritimatiellae bacterium]|nr:hypothetical protein [Kiritimatiellia bacterium]
MRQNILHIAILGIALGWAACASGAYDINDLTDPTKYVQLETSDDHTFSSITNGEHWSTHEPPEAGLKYFVPSAKLITSPLAVGSYAKFKGDELLIAGNFTMYGNNNAYLEIPHFTMFHGTAFDFASAQRSGRRYVGEMTVDPQHLGRNAVNDFVGATLPTRGSSTSISRIQELEYDLVGPANAAIVWGHNKQPGQIRVGLNWYGDNTRYFGKLKVTGDASITNVLGIGTSDMPGTVEIAGYAHFARYTNEITAVGTVGAPNVIGKLVMEGGTTIECAAGAPLTVTDALTLGSGINLAFGSILTPNSYAATPAKTNDVITLGATATGALDLDTFNMLYNTLGPFPGITFSVVTNVDSSTTLRATTREIVEFDNTRNIVQEDIEATEAGKDYLFSSSKSYQSTTGEAFKGETLYLNNVGNFVGTSKSMEGIYAPNLYLAGSTVAHLYTVDTFKVRGCGAYYVRGGMTLDPDYSGKWQIRGGRLLFVESTVSGSADLRLHSIYPGATSHNPGYIEFTALNTNFTGRVITYNKVEAERGVPSESITLTVYATDGRNLGGPLADFTYDALTLSGWCKLATTNSVVFDQANRGIFVQGNGQVEVTSGDTITFMNPLTMAGELLKKGAGTLALGGAMRFIDGEESTEPLAGTNVVTVKAGWLKPLATNALDGAALAFGTGTGIRLDVSPTADGLAEYGFVNVKANGSVGLAAGATGKITVALDGKPSLAVELGVATLPSRSDAETLRSLLSLVRPDGYKGRLTVVDNADGTATVRAVLSSAGTFLIIR